MKLTSRTILLTLVASLAFAGQSSGGQSNGGQQGQHGNQSPDIPSYTATGWIDVIIQFKGVPAKDQLKQLGPYGQV
jgi:hypothetical protein